jgi:hypothetical protein
MASTYSFLIHTDIINCFFSNDDNYYTCDVRRRVHCMRSPLDCCTPGWIHYVVFTMSSRLLYSWMDTLCSIHDVLSAFVLMEGYTV